MNTPTHMHLLLLLWQLRAYSKMHILALIGQMVVSECHSAWEVCPSACWTEGAYKHACFFSNFFPNDDCLKILHISHLIGSGPECLSPFSRLPLFWKYLSFPSIISCPYFRSRMFRRGWRVTITYRWPYNSSCDLMNKRWPSSTEQRCQRSCSVTTELQAQVE